MECTCHDGIVCDICASAQIEETASSIVNPLLTVSEIADITANVTSWLKSVEVVNG